MKKILPVFIILSFLLAVGSVSAKNQPTDLNSGNSRQGLPQTESPYQLQNTPTGNQIQNQNQTQTQNKGEESQIQTNTQNQEATKTASPRSITAEEHMSIVSQKVEELLKSETSEEGIGQQVKQIAQEQKTAQQKIQSELEKVDGRGKLIKLVVGPNYNTLKNMQKQIEQNQLRIQQLAQLQNQLVNQGDITQVQEIIQVLTDQNTALQNKINLEENSSSLFGWLFKLLNK